MLQSMFEHKSTLSFEVFPPKKDGDFESAFQVMDALGALSPDFISVTYGAGGSRAGKMEQHASGKPHVEEGLCRGCRVCARQCAHGAIS